MDWDHRLVDAYYRRRYGFGFQESAQAKAASDFREDLKDVVIFNSRKMDGGMLKNVTIQKARELQLMPCRQCNP